MFLRRIFIVAVPLLPHKCSFRLEHYCSQLLQLCYTYMSMLKHNDLNYHNITARVTQNENAHVSL